MKREEWEARAISQAAIKAQVPVTSPPPSYFTGPGMAYDCLWQGCDYQYEDLNELVIHFLESGGHLIKMGKRFKTNILYCRYRWLSSDFSSVHMQGI
jgi:hypothetical protein